MIVLDTNVVSELMKPTPATSVERWTSAQATTSLYIASITQAEILHGILLLSKGKRRVALETAADAMFTEEFGGRILPFGGEAARYYAEIASARSRAGRSPASMRKSQRSRVSTAQSLRRET
jgi:predicted nucleic acid-binding protein